MLIHGGFWRARYGRELEHPIARDLVGAGGRCGTSSTGGWETAAGGPRRFDDVKAAIEALPGGLPAWWRSATRRAGHLAAWAAGEVPLSGVVSQAGALDLHELWRRGTSDHVVRQLLGGSPDEVPERYEAASPRPPAATPLLLVHGALDEVVPGVDVARVRGGPRLRPCGDRRRGPLRASRARLEVLGGGDRVALTREERRRSTRPTRWPASASASCSPTRSGSTSTATRSAGCRSPPATGCATSSTSGATGSSPAGRTGSTRRRGSATRSPRACSAPGPGEVIVADSTTVNLFKLCSAALDLQPGPLVTDRANFPTDRYVLEGLARRAGSSCGSSTAWTTRSRAPRWWCSRTSTTARASSPTWRASPPRPVRMGARGVGPLALGRRGADRAACGGRRAGGRLHLQVPQRRPGGARLPVRGPRAAAAPAVADPGLVRAARPVRHGPLLRPGRGHRTVHGRDAADPRPRRGGVGRAADRRGRDRALRRSRSRCAS